MPKRALLSVYDKTGIVELGRGLVDLGYEIVSTGGTLAALEAAGVPVTAVSDVTGVPGDPRRPGKDAAPSHPRRIAGSPRRSAHMSALEAHQIIADRRRCRQSLPFAATVARHDVSLADALEQIDIGGPAMIRAAAKNFPGVVVLTDPADYAAALDELRRRRLSVERRRALAAKAFAHTAAYDAVVAEYLRDPEEWPQEVPSRAGWRGAALRGEPAAASRRLSAAARGRAGAGGAGGGTAGGQGAVV